MQKTNSSLAKTVTISYLYFIIFSGPSQFEKHWLEFLDKCSVPKLPSEHELRLCSLIFKATWTFRSYYFFKWCIHSNTKDTLGKVIHELPEDLSCNKRKFVEVKFPYLYKLHIQNWSMLYLPNGLSLAVPAITQFCLKKNFIHIRFLFLLIFQPLLVKKV